MTQNKILVGIPTYNEAKNIKLIVDQILALNLDIDILIVDDNSSDGTGKIVDTLSQSNSFIKAVHRKNKMGIGSAHLHIITYAYDHMYKTLITMDADFSHTPKDIVKIYK